MEVYFDRENSLVDCLNFVDSFIIYNDGKEEKITNADKKFISMVNKVKDVFQIARLMPAFCVSLHEETLNELTNGDWLQINFKQYQLKNGLIFNALLFKLEETQGFNLIRLYEGKYEGRCLYLDLEMKTDLCEIIIE